MTLLMLLMSATLIVLAAIHVTWALGLWWPLRDEERLVRAVIGLRGVTRMPGPIPCALIAVMLLFAAAWPWFPAGWIRTAGLAIAVAGLGLRGVMAWLPGWRRLTPQEPFATLDRTRYGPLTLALAAGFLFLLIKAL